MSNVLFTIWCEWWNRATGFAIPGSVFDPLHVVICFWSAMKRYRRCSRGYRWFFTFLFLNQEHGVNNERLQSIQSVRHFKRMWPHQKDRSAQKRSMLEGLSVSVTDQRLYSEIMDLYMPVYRSSPCLKWCPTFRGFHFSRNIKKKKRKKKKRVRLSLLLFPELVY